MTPPKQTLESEIEKILERDCGQTCPNGAEENKPSLERLLSLIKQVADEVIGEDEIFNPDTMTTTFPYLDFTKELVEFKNSQKEYQRQTLNDILEGRRGL